MENLTVILTLVGLILALVGVTLFFTLWIKAELKLAKFGRSTIFKKEYKK